MKFVTIGAYGYSEGGFFGALQEAGVDVFVDVRRRRGMRGPTYAFVNSNRLQETLHRLGIQYAHLKDLAPTEAIRDIQRAADKDSATRKRTRRSLSPNFLEVYTRQCLENWDAGRFVESLPANTRVVAIFCVEQDPQSCHRSLIAAKLATVPGNLVEHLCP